MADKETLQRIEELTDRLAAQDTRIAELEAAAKPAEFVAEPFEKFDPTSRMQMPPSVVREMVEAVGSTMRDVIADNRHPVNRPSSLLGPEPREPKPTRGSGWIDPAPIGPPPGIQIIDRMLDAADRRDAEDGLDRAVRAARLGQTMRGEK